MTRDDFLTVRWNNLLTLAFGLPILFYVVAVLSGSILSDKSGFIGMFVIGAVY